MSDVKQRLKTDLLSTRVTPKMKRAVVRRAANMQLDESQYVRLLVVVDLREKKIGRVSRHEKPRKRMKWKRYPVYGWLPVQNEAFVVDSQIPV